MAKRRKAATGWASCCALPTTAATGAKPRRCSCAPASWVQPRAAMRRPMIWKRASPASPILTPRWPCAAQPVRAGARRAALPSPPNSCAAIAAPKNRPRDSPCSTGNAARVRAGIAAMPRGTGSAPRAASGRAPANISRLGAGRAMHGSVPRSANGPCAMASGRRHAKRALRSISAPANSRSIIATTPRPCAKSLTSAQPATLGIAPPASQSPSNTPGKAARLRICRAGSSCSARRA